MSHPLITLRASIAKRIKQVRYPEIHWSKCCMDVAADINHLLGVTRVFHPELNEVAFLNAVIRYDDMSIQDAFEMKNPQSKEGVRVCREGQPNAIGHLIKPFMVSKPS